MLNVINVGPFAGDRCCLRELIESILCECVPSVSTLTQLRKLDLEFFLRNGIHTTYSSLGVYEQNVISLFI